MVELARASGQIVAPLLGGALILVIGLEGIIVVDLVTFMCSILVLLLVRIPKSEPTTGETRSAYWEEFVYGWSYLFSRPGLRNLTLFYAAINFLLGIAVVLRTPLVLSFSSPTVLGMVQSVGGIGAVLGGTIMSIWGGPRRRINGVFVFMALVGMSVLLSGVYPSITLIVFAVLCLHVAIPIQSACAVAISLSKVSADVRGRYIAVATTIQTSATALAFLCAGPLADDVFEPFIKNESPFAQIITRVMGSEAGRGIGLLMIILGVGIVVVNFAGYFNPRLRLVEDEIPDASE
jgi:MFS family permease